MLLSEAPQWCSSVMLLSYQAPQWCSSVMLLSDDQAPQRCSSVIRLLSDVPQWCSSVIFILFVEPFWANPRHCPALKTQEGSHFWDSGSLYTVANHGQVTLSVGAVHFGEQGGVPNKPCIGSVYCTMHLRTSSCQKIVENCTEAFCNLVEMEWLHTALPWVRPGSDLGQTWVRPGSELASCFLFFLHSRTYSIKCSTVIRPTQH